VTDRHRQYVAGHGQSDRRKIRWHESGCGWVDWVLRIVYDHEAGSMGCLRELLRTHRGAMLFRLWPRRADLVGG
jgi:hypothetical protein